MNKTSSLIVVSKGPHGSSTCQEALDLALATASFDQHVALAFEDNGHLCFAKDQQYDQSARKNISKMLKALPIYGIDSIYIIENELSRIDSDQLEIPANAETVKPDARANLYQQFSTILHF